MQAVRKIKYFFLFLFLLTQLIGYGQEQKIKLLSSENVRTKPGSVLSIMVSIENYSNQTLEFTPQLVLPQNWQTVIANEDFTISPNSNKLQLLSFKIPQLALAKKYSLSYKIKDKNSSTNQLILPIEIEVSKVINVTLESYESPNFVQAGDLIQAKFIVINNGNTPVSFLLKGNNCQLLQNDSIHLQAQESQILEVESATFFGLTKENRHQLRVEAYTRDEPLPLAYGKAKVSVIPRPENTVDKTGDFHSHAQLSYFTRHQNTQGFASAIQGEFYSQGFLDRAKKHRVELSLRGPDLREETIFGYHDEYYITYENKKAKLLIGDGTYSLTQLTEPSRYGTGLSSTYDTGAQQLGFFYQQPRFFTAIRSEVAGFVSHNFTDQNSIKLSYLQKTFNTDTPNAQIVSLSGQVSPLPNTHLQMEVASGNQAQKISSAFFANIESSPLENVSLRGSVVYAEPNFQGYYDDIFNYSSAVNWDITEKFSLFANIYQNQQNIKQDTIFATAPSTNLSQSGLSYRFSKKTKIRISYQQSRMLDQLPLSKFNRKENVIRLRGQHNFNKFKVTASTQLGKKQNLIDLSNIRTSTLTRASLNLSYSIKKRNFVTGFIQFFESKELTNSPYSSILYGISSRYSLKSGTTVQLQYQNDYALQEYYRDRNLFKLDISQKLGRRHNISLSSNYSLRRGSLSTKVFNAFLKYKYNFVTSLLKTKNSYELQGLIRQEEGKDLSGVVVLLNGETAITNAEGRFHFKGLKAGNYYLLLDPESIDIHQVTDITNPIKVEIQEDIDNEIEFGLKTAASFSGELKIQNNIKSITLPPVIIELFNETESYRQITEANGSFSFLGIRPGHWNVNIITNDIHQGLTFEQTNISLLLEAGEQKEQLIKVFPKKRNIKFQSKLSGK